MMEYDKMIKYLVLRRTALLKENTREFRNNQQNTQNKKNMEYGKVVSDVPIRKDLK